MINRVKCKKFLGVIINETLTWNDHIHTIHNKVSKNIYIIRRIFYNLISETFMLLYYTMIRLCCEYCNFVLAAEEITNLKKLMTTQKKILRFVRKLK